jgi:ABC-type transporter Mla subunit MlaD
MECSLSEARDETYYRELLNATQNGIEAAKLLLNAVATSQTGEKDPTIGELVKSTAKLLEQFEHETDHLWDLFKRVQRGDAERQ